MTIGDAPGARIAGLLDFGWAGDGNWAAITSVPSATWIVVPFCAGVTVTVPCPVLGGGGSLVGVVGGRDGGTDRPEDPEADEADEADGADGADGADETEGVGPVAVAEPVP
jgi:hypothetical protein